MAGTRSISSVESFYTAHSSVNSPDKLSPIINLNGKSYHLTVYHKKPGLDWEEITQSYLKLSNQSEFQKLLEKQIQVPYEKIEITSSIFPNENSICKAYVNGIPTKIPFSLTRAQNTKIFEILKKIKIPKQVLSSSSSSLLSKENLEIFNSSSVKISLEEIKKKRTWDYLEEASESDQQNKKARFDSERAIGLDRLGNNCCINATLQIILNNPQLRQIWKECFPEIADLYYKALNEGKSSVPDAIGNEFRKQLVQKLPPNSKLIDQSLFTQEDPTAFLEVFFNICKEKLNFSHMEINSEKMKYKQIENEEREPSIEQPENHQQFRISLNNQSKQKITLEELLRNNCLEVNEQEEKGKKLKYISEDRYVSLPNHLIIDLLTNNRKDALPVCIPTNLRFPQELLKDKHSTHSYELEGFVVHLGQSDKSGHYIAYRKVNGQWKRFDDNQVTHISEDQLQLLLENFQSVGFIQRLSISAMRYFLGESNPYVCMLSYSKKPSY